MFVFIIFCLFLFFIIPISTQSNCNDIFPSISRDCVLSQTEKQTNKYCCYKKYNSGFEECSLISTEEDYQNEKSKLSESGIVSFVCNDESVTALPEVTWDGCEDIEPSQASDCVMSQEDKSHGYELCCYEKIGLSKVFILDTQESYQEELALLEELGLKDQTTYECNNKVGEAGYLKYSLLFLVFIILNM